MVAVNREAHGNRYSAEVKERAVRLVRETRQRTGTKRGAVAHVARHMGLSARMVKRWVDAADAGRDPLSVERDRVKRLEKENEELRRSNEILQAAAHFFRAELDRRPKP